MFAQPLFDFQEQFALMGMGEFAEKCAELNTLQAIIQAGISNLQTCPIVRNVVDQQITHTSSLCSFLPTGDKWFILLALTSQETGKMARLALEDETQSLPFLFVMLRAA